MPIATIREENGELMFAIPSDIVDQLHLRAGSTVSLELEQKSVVLRPTRSPDSLEQLVREHAEIMHELDPNREWIDMPSVGEEL